MAASIILLHRAEAKTGVEIELPDYYVNTEDKTILDYDGVLERALVPYQVVKQMVEAGVTSQIKVLVDANPFTYDSGYGGTDYIPNRRIELDQGDGTFKFYPSYPIYNPTTGEVTTDAWDGTSVMYLVID